MSSLNCKTRPIPIPNTNLKKYSFKNYNCYEYENCVLPKPRSNSNSYIYLKKYSNDQNIPNNPFGKTPPNKDSFNKIYMNILANTYLNHSDL